MKVAIVGSGVIGLASAYRLAQRGCEVVVLGDRAPGSGASRNNAGWIAPAHSGPVPGPGIVLQTLGWMLHRDSPVYVRPSLSPSFLRFVGGMLRSCNAASYWRGFEATARLAEGTMDELDAWAADGITFEMHHGGEALLFTTDGEFRAAESGLDRVSRAGFEPEILTGDQARALVPSLSDQVLHAIRYPKERRLHPASLIEGLVLRCRELGVEIVENRVERASSTASGGVELRGRAGVVRADACLVAAGAWSPQVAHLFRASLPIRPGKGYLVDYAPAPLDIDMHFFLCEAHVAVTPLEGITRVAGTMEFGLLHERISPIRVRAIRQAPGRYFRDWNPDAPSGAPEAGLRPMTPDGLPVIGRLRSQPNVYVASGHAMLGVTLAARTSSELAGMIVDGGTPEVLEPFSPRRFGA